MIRFVPLLNVSFDTHAFWVSSFFATLISVGTVHYQMQTGSIQKRTQAVWASRKDWKTFPSRETVSNFPDSINSISYASATAAGD